MQSQIPETRYAKSGDVSIAYQVLGEGPIDLVLIPGFISNVELAWEEPGLAAWYRELATFCRLIVFDKRGTGLSDRVTGVANLETRMDDARAVMAAVGSERAVILGYSEGSSFGALFATTYPERTAGLILYGSFFAWDWMAGGRFPARHESVEHALREIEERWGTPDYCDELLAEDAPSKLQDERFRRWYSMRLRLSASPADAAALQRMNADVDTRALLPSIRVPTLIVHRVGDQNVAVKKRPLRRGAHPRRAGTSSFRGWITCPGSATPPRSPAPSANSSKRSPLRRLTRRSATASCRRCSSRTSSAPPQGRRSSATAPGATCWSSITRVSASNWRASAAGRSTRPGTASLRPSMDRRAPSGVLFDSGRCRGSRAGDPRRYSHG